MPTKKSEMTLEAEIALAISPWGDIKDLYRIPRSEIPESIMSYVVSRDFGFIHALWSDQKIGWRSEGDYLKSSNRDLEAEQLVVKNLSASGYINRIDSALTLGLKISDLPALLDSDELASALENVPHFGLWSKTDGNARAYVELGGNLDDRSDIVFIAAESKEWLLKYGSGFDIANGESLGLSKYASPELIDALVRNSSVNSQSPRFIFEFITEVANRAKNADVKKYAKSILTAKPLELADGDDIDLVSELSHIKTFRSEYLKSGGEYHLERLLIREASFRSTTLGARLLEEEIAGAAKSIERSTTGRISAQQTHALLMKIKAGVEPRVRALQVIRAYLAKLDA